jgi:hypothetical protein
MRLDRRLLGWGTFFILLGAIPLAVRAGYVDAAQLERWWSLWPLLLIGWGLGLVLRETPIDWLGGAVTTLTFGIMGGSLIATGISTIPFGAACGGEGGTAFPEQRGTLASTSTVSISLPCGELTIEPVNGNDWSVSGTSWPDRGPVVRTDDGGLQVSAPEGFDLGSKGRPAWVVGLPSAAQGIELDLTLNAGQGRANFDGLSLNGVHVTLNAGDLSVDVARAMSLAGVTGTVNAGSLSVGLMASGQAEFNVNAGSLTICLPEGAEVHVDTAGALGSNNLDELGLEPIGNDWQTPGYDTATSKVILSVTTNAGSFDLAIGGECGA